MLSSVCGVAIAAAACDPPACTYKQVVTYKAVEQQW